MWHSGYAHTAHPRPYTRSGGPSAHRPRGLPHSGGPRCSLRPWHQEVVRTSDGLLVSGQGSESSLRGPAEEKARRLTSLIAATPARR
jgi:hypothetical protein